MLGVRAPAAGSTGSTSDRGRAAGFGASDAAANLTDPEFVRLNWLRGLVIAPHVSTLGLDERQ